MARLDPYLMMLRTVALDLWAAAVLLSLAGIGLFIVFWTAMCLLTVVRARHQLLRQARHLGELSRSYPVRELAEIDEALERILGEERAALPGQRPG
jgi:polyferredoxin